MFCGVWSGSALFDHVPQKEARRIWVKVDELGSIDPVLHANLTCLVIFHAFVVVTVLIFSKLTFSKDSFRITIS